MDFSGMSFYQLQSHKDATLDNKSSGFPNWARTHLWVWHRVVFCLHCSGNICLSYIFDSLRSCSGLVYCCCSTLILHIWRKCNEELSPSSYVTDDLWSDLNCSSFDLYSRSIIMSEFKVFVVYLSSSSAKRTPISSKASKVKLLYMFTTLCTPTHKHHVTLHCHSLQDATSCALFHSCEARGNFPQFPDGNFPTLTPSFSMKSVT